jgi:hypothetical protein
MGTLISGSEAFGDVPVADLAQPVRDAMRDLLREPAATPPR